MKTPAIVVAAFALLALAAPSRARAEGAAFAKGPYLQRLASDRVEVRVELPSAAPAKVEYARAAAGRSLDKGASVVENKEARAFQVLAIAGLEPKTTYVYRVTAGGAKSEEGRFTTAPANDSTAPITFAIFGDNRTGDAAHARLVATMEKQRFDFLVHSGDFVQVGGDGRYWQSFFDTEGPMLRDVCLFACVGNHELYGDADAVAFAKYLGPSDVTGPARLYTTFRWGRARFFLLNAFQNWTTGDERAWLDRELAAADTEPSLEWRFVVLHHGPWAAGPHGSNKALLAAGIPDLFVKHKIDLVIAGHDHIYERGEANGLKYVVSGGGGAPLYDQITRQPSTRKVEATYHFILATIDSAGFKMVTERADGSIVERCGFVHASWDCDGAPSPSAPPSSGAAVAASESPVSRAAAGAPPAAEAHAPTSSCACRAAAATPRDSSPWPPPAPALLAPLAALWLARRRRSASRRPPDRISHFGRSD